MEISQTSQISQFVLDLLRIFKNKTSRYLKDIEELETEYRLVENEMEIYLNDYFNNNNMEKYSQEWKDETYKKVSSYFLLLSESGLYISCIMIKVIWLKKFKNEPLDFIKKMYHTYLLQISQKINKILSFGEFIKWLDKLEALQNIASEKVNNDFKSVIVSNFRTYNKSSDLWNLLIIHCWNISIFSDYVILRLKPDMNTEENREHDEYEQRYKNTLMECLNLWNTISDSNKEYIITR